MQYDSSKRLVVTGLGVISAIGQDKESFWNNVKKGTNGISKVRSFETERFGRHMGGEIENFEVEDFFPGEEEVAKMGRAKQMMLAASAECLKDCGYEVGDDRFRVGVAIGTTMGESKELEAVATALHAEGDDAMNYNAVVDYPPYTIPQAVARYFKLYGPNLMLPNACAAGNFSIGYAIHCLRNGSADAMLAGGADAFSRYAYSGFNRLGAISPDVPRPFSKDRKGMIPGEGAAALFIETYESAVARGAQIYAEIVGYGESCDAHHITQPHDLGIAQAVRSALAFGSIDPKEISFISCHGTGTPTNDVTESRALRCVFGDAMASIPVTSVKSMIGHPMGAASSIECVATLLSIKHQYITPTINFDEVDPNCDVDCVPNEGRSASVNYVLKTSSAFGGNNSSVIFKKAV